MLKRIVTAIALSFLCSLAYAEKAPGPQAREKGDLAIEIVVSDTDKYLKEWLSTPSTHGPTIKRIERAKPDQVLVTSFLVTGLSADEAGDYDFSVSFYLLQPDKKPMFGQQDVAVGNGKLPDTPTFIIADPAIDIVLEKGDPVGVYYIVAQVVDKKNGKKASNSYGLNFSTDDL